MKGRTIKDLKALRVQGIAACYRHLGPKGPKSVGCDRPIATGQDRAILNYREAPRAARKRAGDRPPRDGCYRHLGPKGPKSVGCDRLIATGQDRAITTYRERPRGPREKARGTCPALRYPMTNRRGWKPRLRMKCAVENRAYRLLFRLQLAKRRQCTIRRGDRTGQQPRD